MFFTCFVKLLALSLQCFRVTNISLTHLKLTTMATFKKNMSEIMTLAWQLVKKNGFNMSEALKCAWRNFKLRTAMKSRIVKFYFQKVDGSIRDLARHTGLTYNQPQPTGVF